MHIIHLTEKDFSTNAWSGGETTQLFIYPSKAEYSKRDFLFRISSATIDLEQSDFTMLPGIQRFIATLTDTLKISHDGLNFKCLKPYELYKFDGGLKTTSIGRVRDFNVMLKEGTEARVESVAATANRAVPFSVAGNEIGWIFSFDNRGVLSVVHTDNGTSTQSKFGLQKMSLLVLCKQPEMSFSLLSSAEASKKQTECENPATSTIKFFVDEDANLLCGTVKVTK